MAYTTEQLEGIAAKLREMPPVEKKKQVHSKAEAVRFLGKEIAALQKRGYSLDQIAESLRGEGLDIATPTLKSYLQRAKKGGTVKPRTRPKADAQETAQPVQAAEPTPLERVRQTPAYTPKATFETTPDSDEI